ncbi:helix-turn-helix transcriptional regulator [Chelativorans salis]|uniref:LuxR family transcriptional regulator n=1 Tax=Chelativorans salis TaxID=2978478 RepID=A0ABT2LTV0_9HYPH|nr:LuxR family transcriptional regulator [Chelativorans sp. EGI FJ00035]MCT7377966.1 LuxR family transcriptional regulator [Chelativorans sp. EGI FJ00035]
MDMGLSEYAQTAFSFIEGLEALPDKSDVLRAIEHSFSQFGLTTIVMSDLPLPQESAQDIILLEKWPHEWSALYLGRKYLHWDPVARFCRNTPQAFDWNEAPYDHELEPQADEIMALARDFGMPRGFCVPVPGFAHRCACVSMSGQYAELTPQTKPAIQLMAIYAAEHVKRITASGRPLKNCLLTAREREVLRWAAAGKSATATAEILNIKERTVTAHTINAMDKLGAANKTQAVVRALQHRLIPLDL